MLLRLSLLLHPQDLLLELPHLGLQVQVGHLKVFLGVAQLILDIGHLLLGDHCRLQVLHLLCCSPRQLNIVSDLSQ